MISLVSTSLYQRTGAARQNDHSKVHSLHSGALRDNHSILFHQAATDLWHFMAPFLDQRNHAKTYKHIRKHLQSD